MPLTRATSPRATPKSLQRLPTVLAGRWPFPALVTPLLPWTVSMGTTFIVHPAASFVAMLYPFPPRYLGDEDQDTYKRRRRPFGQRVRSLVGILGSQVHHLGAQTKP